MADKSGLPDEAGFGPRSRVAANHDDVGFCRFFPGSGFRVPVLPF
jgi:hypothetical protein